MNGKALYHQGVPSPYAGLVLSTAIAVSTWPNWMVENLLLSVLFPGTWYELHSGAVLVFVLGAAMISNRMKLKLDGGLLIPATTVAIFGTHWALSPPQSVVQTP
jgi:CDP-diacylglycerol--serine O-phosphatidyltransferase